MYMNNPEYFVRGYSPQGNTDRDDRPAYTSLIYGVALGQSIGGKVEVKILGNGESNSEAFNNEYLGESTKYPGSPRFGINENPYADTKERGVVLPTSVRVEQSDIVLITTTGQTERRMIVTGVVGGGDTSHSNQLQTEYNVRHNGYGIDKINFDMARYDSYWGTPVMDGTNLVRNASFSSGADGNPSDWDVSITGGGLSIANDYTNGNYHSVKITPATSNFKVDIKQTIPLPKMFTPTWNDDVIFSAYYYIEDPRYGTLNPSRISIGVYVDLHCDEFSEADDISIPSDSFDSGIPRKSSKLSVTSDDASPSIFWGRAFGHTRIKYFMDWYKPPYPPTQVYAFTNPRAIVRIHVEADYLMDLPTVYLNRPKLEWGGLMTPWTP